MLIIGHPWVAHNKFRKIFSADDIKESNTSEIMLLEPLVESHGLAKYCQENDVAFALSVNTLKAAIFANNLGASYIICEADVASIIHPIAEQYLFDTQLLVLISDEKEIENISRLGIDGVIFPEAIV